MHHAHSLTRFSKIKSLSLPLKTLIQSHVFASLQQFRLTAHRTWYKHHLGHQATGFWDTDLCQTSILEPILFFPLFIRQQQEQPVNLNILISLPKTLKNIIHTIMQILFLVEVVGEEYPMLMVFISLLPKQGRDSVISLVPARVTSVFKINQCREPIFRTNSP